jgi:hypothetical protein
MFLILPIFPSLGLPKRNVEPANANGNASTCRSFEAEKPLLSAIYAGKLERDARRIERHGVIEAGGDQTKPVAPADAKGHASSRKS